MSKEQFYDKVTLATDFTKTEFGFESDHMLIVHDGSGDITFSWSGETGSNDGELVPADSWIQFDELEKSRIFMKSTNAGDDVRIWAWRSGK